MNRKKILVMTDQMPWGHRSIAKAIYEGIKEKERQWPVKVDLAQVDVDLGIGNDIYTFFYRHAPKGWRIFSEVVFGDKKNRRITRGVMKEVMVMNLPRMKKVVVKYKPDLIICAYHFNSNVLTLLRESEPGLNFELWTVAADPWTFMPGSVVPGADKHLVYDEVTRKKLEGFGIDKKRIVETGWWVRPEMYRPHDRDKVRKKLGFKDERPVVFVGGGSLGTSALTRFLPLLLFVRKKVGIIFNTGMDKSAYRLVERYVKVIRSIGLDKRVQIKNMGWIDNMAEVLAVADIVFGKAGPNFLFDTIAAGKPFVSITHIGGQEDGNIEIIKKKKLGWVKEKNGQLAKFFVRYLRRPKYYNQKYLKTIKKEGKRNRQSIERIWQQVEKEFGWGENKNPAKS